MDHMLKIIEGNYSYYLLTALISAALFLVVVGIRTFGRKYIDSFLYLTTATFLIAAHIFYMMNIPLDSELTYLLARMNLWYWAILILAPALIFLFVAFSLYNFVINNYRSGLIKLFFGLTLLGFIFIFGLDWSISLKAIIVFLFSYIYFTLELKPVQ